MKLRGEVKNSEMLGRMLRQGRVLSDMTQQQLADQLGISQRYVWDLERGKPSVVMTRLFQVMRATGVRLVAELDHEIADTNSSQVREQP